MRKTAIVTDTNSGMLPEQAAELGVYLISMPFLIGGESVLENAGCTREHFFERLAAGAEVSTSQPAPAELTELWERLLQDHDAVLYFPMSSELSGSCQTAKILAMDYPDRVFVVDNRRISVTLMQSIRRAVRLAEEGMPAAEIRSLLEKRALDASIYIAVPNLEYLKRGGRITAAGAAMGTLLNLKPVLQIQGGKLDAYKTVRGMNLACDTMIHAIRQDMETRFAGRKMRLFAVYSQSEEAGTHWKEAVQAAFPDQEVEMAALPLSICCHIGPGALAIACAEEC